MKFEIKLIDDFSYDIYDFLIIRFPNMIDFYEIYRSFYIIDQNLYDLMIR